MKLKGPFDRCFSIATTGRISLKLCNKEREEKKIKLRSLGDEGRQKKPKKNASILHIILMGM